MPDYSINIKAKEGGDGYNATYTRGEEIKVLIITTNFPYDIDLITSENGFTYYFVLCTSDSLSLIKELISGYNFSADIQDSMSQLSDARSFVMRSKQGCNVLPHQDAVRRLIAYRMYALEKVMWDQQRLLFPTISTQTLCWDQSDSIASNRRADTAFTNYQLIPYPKIPVVITGFVDKPTVIYDLLRTRIMDTWDVWIPEWGNEIDPESRKATLELSSHWSRISPSRLKELKEAYISPSTMPDRWASYNTSPDVAMVEPSNSGAFLRTLDDNRRRHIAVCLLGQPLRQPALPQPLLAQVGAHEILARAGGELSAADLLWLEHGFGHADRGGLLGVVREEAAAGRLSLHRDGSVGEAVPVLQCTAMGGAYSAPGPHRLATDPAQWHQSVVREWYDAAGTLMANRPQSYDDVRHDTLIDQQTKEGSFVHSHYWLYLHRLITDTDTVSHGFVAYDKMVTGQAYMLHRATRDTEKPYLFEVYRKQGTREVHAMIAFLIPRGPGEDHLLMLFDPNDTPDSTDLQTTSVILRDARRDLGLPPFDVAFVSYLGPQLALDHGTHRRTQMYSLGEQGKCWLHATWLGELFIRERVDSVDSLVPVLMRWGLSVCEYPFAESKIQLAQRVHSEDASLDTLLSDLKDCYDRIRASVVEHGPASEKRGMATSISTVRDLLWTLIDDNKRKADAIQIPDTSTTVQVRNQYCMSPMRLYANTDSTSAFLGTNAVRTTLVNQECWIYQSTSRIMPRDENFFYEGAAQGWFGDWELKSESGYGKVNCVARTIAAMALTTDQDGAVIVTDMNLCDLSTGVPVMRYERRVYLIWENLFRSVPEKHKCVSWSSDAPMPVPSAHIHIQYDKNNCTMAVVEGRRLHQIRAARGEGIFRTKVVSHKTVSLDDDPVTCARDRDALIFLFKNSAQQVRGVLEPVQSRGNPFERVGLQVEPKKDLPDAVVEGASSIKGLWVIKTVFVVVLQTGPMTFTLMIASKDWSRVWAYPLDATTMTVPLTQTHNTPMAHDLYHVSACEVFTDRLHMAVATPVATFLVFDISREKPQILAVNPHAVTCFLTPAPEEDGTISLLGFPKVTQRAISPELTREGWVVPHCTRTVIVRIHDKRAWEPEECARLFDDRFQQWWGAVKVWRRVWKRTAAGIATETESAILSSLESSD